MFDEWDAVVYDLDGTLVHLAVDWAAVAVDVVATFTSAGIDATDQDLWDLLDRSRDVGLRAEVESVIAEHEMIGAREGERLALADQVPRVQVPVGVCSLNCEAACRLALREQELDGHVEIVVGRDTVDTWKPDPEPLEAVVRELGATPSGTLFVGDSERDELTAERAGTSFTYVRELRDRMEAS